MKSLRKHFVWRLRGRRPNTPGEPSITEEYKLHCDFNSFSGLTTTCRAAAKSFGRGRGTEEKNSAKEKGAEEEEREKERESFSPRPRERKSTACARLNKLPTSN